LDARQNGLSGGNLRVADENRNAAGRRHQATCSSKSVLEIFNSPKCYQLSLNGNILGTLAYDCDVRKTKGSDYFVEEGGFAVV
jgi:hypothetical protein